MGRCQLLFSLFGITAQNFGQTLNGLFLAARLGKRDATQTINQNGGELLNVLHLAFHIGRLGLAIDVRGQFLPALLQSPADLFDQFIAGEWEGLHRVFAQRPDWLDGITIDLDHLDHVFPKAPGSLDVFCMQEISMYAMIPWGGYGANPMPERIKRYWDKIAGRTAGAYPYSEGIYEDLNKIVALQLQW